MRCRSGKARWKTKKKWRRCRRPHHRAASCRSAAQAARAGRSAELLKSARPSRVRVTTATMVNADRCQCCRFSDLLSMPRQLIADQRRRRSGRSIMIIDRPDRPSSITGIAKGRIGARHALAEPPKSVRLVRISSNRPPNAKDEIMRGSRLAYLALAPSVLVCLGSTANARKRPCIGCPPTITTVHHAQIFDGQICCACARWFCPQCSTSQSSTSETGPRPVHALVPGAARVGLLVDPTNVVNTESAIRDAEEAARSTIACLASRAHPDMATSCVATPPAKWIG